MITDIPTPFVALDVDKVQRNIDRLAEYACAHQIEQRPHIKTHKLPQLAEKQVAAGATGITVAKVGELEVMLQAGLPNILLAYPVVTRFQQRRLAELACEADVTVALDHIDVAAGISEAASLAGSTVKVLVEQDVGAHRVGVQSSEAAQLLGQQIDGMRALELAGIAFYVGHVWGPPSEQASTLRAIEGKLADTRRKFSKAGLCCDIVSGGSTPTAFQSHLVDSCTEIRSGNYIFYDMNSAAAGICQIEDCALRIYTSVVSTAVPGQIVVDAGSKTLTSDLLVTNPGGGYGFLPGAPEARVSKLSEEHGQVDISGCQQKFSIAQRIAIIPNHACVAMNMQNHVHLVRGNELLETLPVAARGMVV